MIQKIIAFSIVAVAAIWLLYKLFSATLRPVLSKWLLKKGKVDLAQKIQGLSSQPKTQSPDECDPKIES